MKNIDWARKLSSRKFWVCVCGFVSTLAMGFGVAENVAAQIISTIMAGGCLVAYIIAEGWVDAASAETYGHLDVAGGKDEEVKDDEK